MAHAEQGAAEGGEQAFWLAHLGAADRFTSWVISEIRPYLGRAILEVGCGTGTFTRCLARDAERVLALDIDPRFAAEARTAMAHAAHVRVECADATVTPLARDFDTVVLLDVLEHIADDIGFLRKLRDALRPGGRIVIKVPAIPRLFCRMDAAIGHHRRYSRSTLAHALAAVGFVLDVCKPFNAAAIAGWWLNGKVLKRTMPPAEQVGAFNRLVPVLSRAERLLRTPFGLSLIAAARRAELPQ
jgi:2-polyprenyl-3-methyl-5-hydroxy-6-metoxy-1,4-benzoquinol methylase